MENRGRELSDFELMAIGFEHLLLPSNCSYRQEDPIVIIGNDVFGWFSWMDRNVARVKGSE
jgi:hypothetical protein